MGSTESPESLRIPISERLNAYPRRRPGTILSSGTLSTESSITTAHAVPAGARVMADAANHTVGKLRQSDQGTGVPFGGP